ncbi:hypothetical protein EST35_0143 [Pseudomonas phage vB_PaeM_PA5oct]|uniref:Uncharacterized protein n=1 Tax=Pseudomonas phage vB_PaeM_PA5oct TaxID=2163605 RepID=A0A4Y5JUF2_9CAUD|nr:hypothetical protein PQE65_gp340 [Pseudomonas phage vB_PaeM_PA5oct]QCG76025.1 hypothetical protein EST35_0143 [Pseudomonas phage vB_PaeM_PA5oct]
MGIVSTTNIQLWNKAAMLVANVFIRTSLKQECPLPFTL